MVVVLHAMPGWGGSWIRCACVPGRGCPLIGRLSSCVLRHALSFGLLFFSLPVLVFLVFFEFASSSGYSSIGALLPDRVDPSGRSPSQSSQLSGSWWRVVAWACCRMVVVPMVLPRFVGPLGWCIGRVMVGVEGSLWFGELIFWGIFGMSVEVAVLFSGT